MLMGFKLTSYRQSTDYKFLPQTTAPLQPWFKLTSYRQSTDYKFLPQTTAPPQPWFKLVVHYAYVIFWSCPWRIFSSLCNTDRMEFFSRRDKFWTSCRHSMVGTFYPSSHYCSIHWKFDEIVYNNTWYNNNIN